jgi:trimeric autotransporter adhesin
MKTFLTISFFSLFVMQICFAQDITNTLAPGAKFIVKDAANNFLTLDQATGQMNLLKTLQLENTTSSTIGVIYNGANRFIHNYGSYNTFMGINSGNFNMTGFYNTAVGYYSLFSNITGYHNTSVGYYSLYSNTSGDDNTAVGFMSLNLNTTGYWNTAVGRSALTSNTTGYSNTAVGESSLASDETGYQNTAIGNFAGYDISSGNNLMCLGYNAQPTTGTATNQITLGNNQVTSIRCNVTTITSLSDARDKKNIKDLGLGIDFLMKIKPRQFNWDKREWYDNNVSDGSKMKEEPTAGFIAQELDEAQATGNAEWLNLVLKDNPEKWEATPGNLLPIMVKAIQDLNLKCGELKAEKDLEITKLKSENDELKKEVASLKSMNEKLATLEQLVNEFTSIKLTSFNVAH